MKEQKRFSMDRAIELQELSKTAKEAKANFECSCSMCYKQAWCKEELCRLHKAHVQRMEYLEAMSKPHGTITYVATREYNIPKARAIKKAVLKKLQTFIKSGNNSEFVVMTYKHISDKNYGLLEQLYKQNVGRGRIATSDINREVYPIIKEILMEV